MMDQADTLTDFPDFSSLLGQDKAKELLQNAHRNTRLGHAFLFRGPEGVGKKRAALTFAAYINCLTPDHTDACGHCRSCLKFRSGNHPDLLLIEPEGIAIKIDQIRRLKQDLIFPPFEAHHRVVILTDVHAMRREAANSLLKTLEEPPADTIIILIAGDRAEILPTITSRCQEIPFHALPYDQVAEEIRHRNDIPYETAFTLAAVTEGSLGRARFLQENNLLALRTKIVTALLEVQSDSPEAIDTVFALAEEAAALKENIPELIHLLRMWLRDIILALSGVSEEMIASRDLVELLPSAIQRWKYSAVTDRLNRLDQAEKQLRRNCNRGLVCEVLFFGLL